MLRFLNVQDALKATRLARCQSDLEQLKARVAATVDWSFEHYKNVNQGMLSATLRAIHCAHSGEGLRDQLSRLTDRTEALIAKDPQENWTLLLARLLLSLSERERYVDHVFQFIAPQDKPISRLMARIAGRWGSDSYPDYNAEKIFCIGLSRTGTKSLASALTLLGYDTAHWLNPITQNILCRDDYFLFEGYSDITVAADLPWLRENFSNARYILTERDSASWEPSIARHYYSIAGVNAPIQLSTQGASRFSGRPAAVADLLYGGVDSWGDAGRAYTQTVNKIFSADVHRLLTMNIVAGDGWDELCAFLDRPHPRASFPHNP